MVARGGEVLPRVVPALGADTPRGPGALTAAPKSEEMALPKQRRECGVREVMTAGNGRIGRNFRCDISVDFQAALSGLLCWGAVGK
jgi:hypothetical protein